ncbi:hypothetical protein PHLH8_35500 [Pseudomonas sp. Pc102]|uniref:hypothetical protein n=1 Tax=Pseudomonas sp. Pc102 TaxID=2678261 RepID=UPI001BD1AB2C|nr:hypothetical protein [Pseudomonas sp. Pc102]BBP83908.1 hypothetical protein PHLH8_35500 [Pseudomonas sp. Pc102]
MHTHYEGLATLVYVPGNTGSSSMPTASSAAVVLDETIPGIFSVTCDLDLGDADELRITLPNGRSVGGVITYKDGRTLNIVTRS